MKTAAENFINWFSSTYGKLTTVVLFAILVFKGTLMFVDKKTTDAKFQENVFARWNETDKAIKEIQEAQEFAKVRSKLVLKLNNAAYYVTDSIGQTIEMSKEAETITGWPIDDLMGYKWHSHITEPDASKMLLYMNSTLRSQTNLVYTYTMSRPDNTRVRIKTFADRVHYPNQPYRTKGYVGVLLKAAP